METKVIILAGKSLITNGVTNRLRQHSPQVDFDVIHLEESDPLEKLVAASPSIIILDGADPQVSATLPISTLMDNFPALKVICLDSESSQTRVIQWALQPIVRITDLLNAL